MVRPRLVEEGVPIYGPGSDLPPRRIPPPADDEDMIDPRDCRHDTAILSSSNTTNNQEQQPMSSSSSSSLSSSLQRMVGHGSGKARLSSKGKVSRTVTSYEIGRQTSLTSKESNLSPQDASSSWMEPSSPPPPPPSTEWDGNNYYNNYNNHHQYHPCYDQQHHYYQQSTGDPSVSQSTPTYSTTVIGEEDDPNDVSMDMETETHFKTVHLPSSSSSSSGYRLSHHGNPTKTTTARTMTSYTIGQGGDEVEWNHQQQPMTEKMVGVEDHGQKSPLVVLDGANIAHAYGTALNGMYSNSPNHKNNNKVSGGRKIGKDGTAEPDAIGIDVAVRYFQRVGVRVLIVLPQYWFRRKGEWNTTTIRSVEQQQILNHLQEQGLIVVSPPTDDDDAYAMTIAQREESRSLRRPTGEGPGFILSNDMFRDAQGRDTTDALRHWLNDGRNVHMGPGRISYSFADMGTMNDHGERILDFVPNPRHPLVIWIENMGLHGE